MMYAVESPHSDRQDRDDALNVASIAARAAESLDLVLAHEKLVPSEQAALQLALRELEAWEAYLDSNSAIARPSRRSLSSMGLVARAVRPHRESEDLEAHRRTLRGVLEGTPPATPNLKAARDFFDQLSESALTETTTSGERLTKATR